MSSASQLAKSLLTYDTHHQTFGSQHQQQCHVIDRRRCRRLLMTESRGAEGETFVRLASVCRLFHNILTARKWFGRTFQHYLSGRLLAVVGHELCQFSTR